jgi:Zn-dependent protease/predicted transcriptional regulator
MRGWRIGSIRGIVIEINYTWLIIFGLFFFSLSTSWFPKARPDEPHIYDWIAGLVATLLLFASVLLHELAHSLVAQRSGIGVSRITLFVFGGVSQLNKDPEKPASEFVMAIVGPLTSLVLTGLFSVGWLLAKQASGVTLLELGLKYLALTNGILAAFNLVPAFPLDGGRVLRSVIWHFTGDLEQSTRVAATFGQVFGFALMALGFWMLLTGNAVSGLWFIVLGWLLAGAAQSSYVRLQMQNALGDVRVSQVMSSPAVTIPPDISLERAVEDYFLRLRHGAFPVLDEGGKLVGMLSLSGVKEHDRGEWQSLRVDQAMEPLEPGEMTIAPEAEALDAMLKMARAHRGRLLVTDSRGELQGVISQSDIVQLVRLKAGLQH